MKIIRLTPKVRWFLIVLISGLFIVSTVCLWSVVSGLCVMILLLLIFGPSWVQIFMIVPFLISAQTFIKEADNTELIKKFIEKTERKENRKGLPLVQLKINGEPFIDTDGLPVYIFKRERKEKGKRIIYTVYAKPVEILDEESTHWVWHIIQPPLIYYGKG